MLFVPAALAEAPAQLVSRRLTFAIMGSSGGIPSVIMAWVLPQRYSLFLLLNCRARILFVYLLYRAVADRVASPDIWPKSVGTDVAFRAVDRHGGIVAVLARMAFDYAARSQLYSACRPAVVVGLRHHYDVPLIGLCEQYGLQSGSTGRHRR